MYLSLFAKLLKESFRDLLPIIIVILFFQLAIIQNVPENWMSVATGMGVVAIGLAIFLLGLEIGIFPVGESLAKDFSQSKKTIGVILFGFFVGFGTTIAEPALIVIAEKAANISQGRINSDTLRLVVALSVGVAILLGVWRIIKGHPIHYYIISGYLLVVGITYFAPKEIIGLAYDLGGVTTSTVTVPLVAALGIGLSTAIKGRNPMIDGFGLIAMASLTPMIFVQIYGIYVYNFVEINLNHIQTASEAVNQAVPNLKELFSFQSVIQGLGGSFTDVLPIICIILFFQFLVLRKMLPNWQNVVAGFLLVIIGLYAFTIGLEMGLFTLGENMAYDLTKLNSEVTIFGFAFLIGLSTTFAEPALIAISRKSVEISENKINDLILRFFVALGVGIGITLGAYRIIEGDSIHYYIMVGYTLVIILTAIAPKYIVPIAYDSGGVTTSTITVPLVTALGIGLASNIDGRNPLIDGFGLIAFASLFPMITVMVYGIIIQRKEKKSSNKNIITETSQKEEILVDNQTSVKASNLVNHGIVIDGKAHPNLASELNLSFSAVIAIVPKDKKELAVESAKSAGASGVTMVDAEGMGLTKFDNLFRVSHEVNDVVLLFLLPDHMTQNIINAIIERLQMDDNHDGIVFSFPISQINGISLRQQDIFKEKEIITQ